MINLSRTRRCERILTSLLVLFFLTSNIRSGWREVPPPTTKSLSKLSFLDSLRGWVAGFDGTILRTTNGGLSWQAQNAGVTNHVHDIFMLNERLGWALAFQNYLDTNTWYGTQILRTTDGGETWTHRDYPIAGEFFNTILFRDSLRGWIAGEYGHMVRTTDAGASWIPVEVDSSDFSRWRLLNIQFFTPRYGFASGGHIDIIGVVWRTTNGGVRWTPEPVSPEPVHALHMIDSLNILGISGDVDYGASTIRTTDGGESWRYTYLDIFGEPLALSFRTRSEGWVPLGFVGRLMYTLDTGATWSVVDVPKRRPMHDLAFTDSLTGYAVGDSGMILKFHPSFVPVGEHPPVPTSSFALLQNYPNPFNPTTKIEFRIANREFVSLSVYDVLGREVATLVNEVKQPGEYAVQFDASTFAGGVYFYRLHAGSFVQTKKLCLIR